MLCNKLQCVWEMADIALADKVCLGHRNLSSTTALRSTCTRVRMLALQDEVPLKGAEVWRTIPSQKWQWVYPLIRHLLHVPSSLFLTPAKRHFCKLAQAAVATDLMCMWLSQAY